MSRSTQPDSGFLTEYQVYEPHKTGLPPMRPYLTELWRRRHFAAELSRTNMRASNTRTFFGQIWLVINPLLLALVYYMLVDILGSQATPKPGAPTGMEKLSHMVGGIFAFYLISGCITTGAASVVGSGGLIANMSFPRLLMPFSATRTAFFRFRCPSRDFGVQLRRPASGRRPQSRAERHRAGWQVAHAARAHRPSSRRLAEGGLGRGAQASGGCRPRTRLHGPRCRCHVGSGVGGPAGVRQP
jgi:hypothetical protein